MRAERLLRLYPRGWRDRYGDEFLELAGGQPLTVQQVIDIISGAIDARLSGDVQHATRASAQGGTMTVNTMICSGSSTRYTKTDALIGAGVMLVTTVFFALVGLVLKTQGLAGTSEALVSLAFPVSLMLSMPFWLTKGQPWKAQVVILTVVTVLLIGATWVGKLI